MTIRMPNTWLKRQARLMSGPLAPALKRAIDIVKRGEPALVDVITQGR